MNATRLEIYGASWALDTPISTAPNRRSRRSDCPSVLSWIREAGDDDQNLDRRKSMASPQTTEAERIATAIAQQTLGLETLESRGLDRHDFHDISVMALKEALVAAFNAGANYVKGQRVS